MGVMFYRSCRAGGRFILWQTMRQMVLDAGRTDRDGGFILACTHLSHLEPFIISGAMQRQVRWMARVEFYKYWWQAAVMNGGGAFPVNRYGYNLPSVRNAVRLAKAGECVGIFPEGGVTQGRNSVMRGAAFKQGVCTIAVEAQVPIVPVVVLGTDRLNCVGPWLPFRRGQLWTAFGEDVLPPPRSESRRADRIETASRLSRAFVDTYQHLLNRSGLTDDFVP